MANSNLPSEEVRLLTKVSSLYYEYNHNQQSIADRLHLSRPKVSRLLKKARQIGIVQISIKEHQENFVELENVLEEKFELKEAIILKVDGGNTPATIKKLIGSASAEYLFRTINNRDTLGVTWGTTLQAMVDSMMPNPLPETHVVQVLGGVGPPEAKAHATDISRRLSQLLKSHLTLLPAPGIIGSIEAKNILLDDRQVRGAFDLFSEIDILFVGLGAIKTNPVLDQNAMEMSSGLHKKIIDSKAVGDIALHFFDIDGNEIDSELKDLIIGISIEEIKKIDTVVGIAGGEEKVDVIKGALNGKLIDVLITDNETAKKLL